MDKGANKSKYIILYKLIYLLKNKNCGIILTNKFGSDIFE